MRKIIMNELLWVILAWVFNLSLGMFWYSPSLFWKIWYKAKWFIHEDMQNKKMPLHALFKAIWNSLFIAIILSAWSHRLWFSTFEEHVSFAIILWFIVSTNEISKYIWEQEKFVLVPLNSIFSIFSYVWMISIIFYI